MYADDENHRVEHGSPRDSRPLEKGNMARGLKLSYQPAATGGDHAAPDAGLDSGWPALPEPLGVSRGSQASYPAHGLPEYLAGVLGALQRLAQCSQATAAAAVLGAVSLLIQADFRVQTLAELPSPASLFLVTMAESGDHKSAGFDLAAAGHEEADTRLEMRWEEAREMYEGVKDESEEPALRRLRPWAPCALVNDITTDGLMDEMKAGRHSVAVWESEIGIQFNYAMAKSRLNRTLSTFIKGWDGKRIVKLRADKSQARISLPTGSYALTICWAGQPDLLVPFLFSQDTARGFLARCLLSLDDGPLNPGTPQPGDRDLLKNFRNRIIAAREVQDRDMEYHSPPAFRRGLVALSRNALGLLQDFNADQKKWGVELRRDRRHHELGMAKRAPEQVARIAASFTAWPHYPLLNPEPGTLITDEECIERAIALVSWYQNELCRLAPAANTTIEASDAAHLAELITLAVSDPKFREGPNPMVSPQGVLVKTLANRRGTPTVRGNPKYVTSLIKLLVDSGYIRPSRTGRPGRYETHPRLAEALF